MEAIVKIVEGTEPQAGKCKFCSEKASKVFCVIDAADKRYNGFQLKGFHICTKHLTAINSLLDGSKDINLLVKNYEKITSCGKINLRANV